MIHTPALPFTAFPYHGHPLNSNSVEWSISRTAWPVPTRHASLPCHQSLLCTNKQFANAEGASGYSSHLELQGSQLHHVPGSIEDVLLHVVAPGKHRSLAEALLKCKRRCVPHELLYVVCLCARAPSSGRRQSMLISGERLSP